MSARALHLLAPLAVLQMAMPGPARASTLMVASCGGSGATVPIRVPQDDGGGKNLPCCKVCHIAMRKRAGSDSCCEDGDEGPEHA